MNFIELIGGVLWAAFSLAIAYLFITLTWAAYKDLDFRKSFFKTVDGKTKHPFGMQCLLWIMAFLIIFFWIYMAFVAASAAIEQLR